MPTVHTLSLLKKLAGETVLYGISNVLSRMVNFLMVPLYTHTLADRADYGTVTILYAYVGFIMVFATYRMETGFFRFGSEEGQKERAFSTAMLALLATTPILVGSGIFFSQEIAAFLRFGDAPRYVVWFSLIIGMDTLTRVPLARLRLDSRPRRFVAVQMTNILVNVGMNVFFIVLCPILLENGHEWVNRFFNPDHLVDYVFISNLVASAVMLLMLSPSFLKIRWDFDKALFRRITYYVLPLVPVGIAAVINEVMDKPMLEWWLPGTNDENKAQVGIYAANYKLAALLTIITQGFNYAAEPFFFRNKDRGDTRSLYGKVGQAFAIIGSVGFLGIMLFVDLVKHIIGNNYATNEGQAVIPIILMANLCLGLYYNFGIWYKLADRTRMGMYIAFAGVAVTAGMNYFLIPHWGFMASAWATLCCYASMMTLAYALGQRYYPIHYPIYRMMGYAALALAFYGVSLLLPAWEGALGYMARAAILIAYFSILFRMEKQGLLKDILKGND